MEARWSKLPRRSAPALPWAPDARFIGTERNSVRSSKLVKPQMCVIRGAPSRAYRFGDQMLGILSCGAIAASQPASVGGSPPASGGKSGIVHPPRSPVRIGAAKGKRRVAVHFQRRHHATRIERVSAQKRPAALGSHIFRVPRTRAARSGDRVFLSRSASSQTVHPWRPRRSQPVVDALGCSTDRQQRARKGREFVEHGYLGILPSNRKSAVRFRGLIFISHGSEAADGTTSASVPI